MTGLGYGQKLMQLTSDAQRSRAAEYSRAYRKRHPDRAKASLKASWEKNKHKYLAKKSETKKKLYAAKRDEILAKNAEYHRLNGDKIRAQQREYRLRNLEARKQNCRDWYQKNKPNPDFKAKETIRSQRDFQRHKAKRVSKHKEWMKRNPGYMSAVKHRRRLVENASKNLVAIKAWMKSVKSQKTAICYYCQGTISTKGIHFDHIVPISKGGIHDVSNLCVACAKCNLTKQAKPITAWIKVGQQILSL